MSVKDRISRVHCPCCGTLLLDCEKETLLDRLSWSSFTLTCQECWAATSWKTEPSLVEGILQRVTLTTVISIKTPKGKP